MPFFRLALRIFMDSTLPSKDCLIADFFGNHIGGQQKEQRYQRCKQVDGGGIAVASSQDPFAVHIGGNDIRRFICKGDCISRILE